MDKFCTDLKKFDINWAYQREDKSVDGRYCYARQAQAIIDYLFADLAASEKAREEEARKFYRADGSFEILDSPEEVVRRRIEAAGRIAQLEESIQEAKGLLGCICSNDFKNPEGDADKSAWKAYSILEDVALASPSAAAEVLIFARLVANEFGPALDAGELDETSLLGRLVKSVRKMEGK